MQRRSFLKTAASIVPATALHDLLAAQTPVAPPAAALHVVASGEDLAGHPHSLGMSTMSFKVVASQTSGGLFVVEHTHLRHGGPVLHYHLNQEEWFNVIEGEVAFQVGEQRLLLRSGDSVLAPRRIPHTFCSVSSTPARMLIAFCPAGKMEAYFNDAEAAGANAGSEPAFMRRYEMEYVGPNPLINS